MITRIGNLNFIEATGEPETPVGSLEGEDTDNIELSYVGGGSRTMNHSFSQTLIPEVAVVDEILDNPGD